MKLPKCLAILVAMHLLEILFLIVMWLGLEWQTRRALSDRLRIQGVPVSLESYFISSFVPGLSRGEVMAQADAIGPYWVKPYFIADEYCETLAFYTGPFNSRMGEPWSICYDESDQVISVTSAGRQ